MLALECAFRLGAALDLTPLVALAGCAVRFGVMGRRGFIVTDLGGFFRLALGACLARTRMGTGAGFEKCPRSEQEQGRANPLKWHGVCFPFRGTNSITRKSPAGFVAIDFRFVALAAGRIR